ncbi:hypothetical protein SAMN05216252_14010 [Actinacidiphila glaucinigra]|uniref:Uncharacterized protein n=1 Tax=Actinacidiphila glaucinigra TaxID=235986 RepID=A0A239NL83_9ACTN|nr:hypothetical protein SAMN05216252_14010 [Actinacidiphila glaucinigra]
MSVPTLYGQLVSRDDLPDRVLEELRRFQWDFVTFKVGWAPEGAVPWSSPAAAQAGSVHLAEGVDALTQFAAEIAMGQVPERPFLLFGQMTTADGARSPSGTQSAWTYTHLSHRVRGDAGGAGITGTWTRTDRELMADRVEAQVERYAPGFRSLVAARRVLAPPQIEANDANLSGGAINGGTAACTSNWSSVPSPVRGGRRRRSPACSWHPPGLIRAARPRRPRRQRGSCRAAYPVAQPPAERSTVGPGPTGPALHVVR